MEHLPFVLFETDIHNDSKPLSNKDVHSALIYGDSYACKFRPWRDTILKEYLVEKGMDSQSPRSLRLFGHRVGRSLLRVYFSHCVTWGAVPKRKISCRKQKNFSSYGVNFPQTLPAIRHTYLADNRIETHVTTRRYSLLGTGFVSVAL